MSELIRRAAALVPHDALSDSGSSVADVLDYLEHDEWELALDVLADFDGIDWQTPEFWDLLVKAADELHLDVKWFHWRKGETLHGLLRADLELGARQAPIPGAGVLKPLWNLGDGELRVAALWVESMPELAPGGRATVRLRPLTPQAWHHLVPGDVITMHEQPRPVAGTATVIEYARVGETRQRDR